MEHPNDDFELDDASVVRFQSLLRRFDNDLQGALDRADAEFAQHMPSKGDVCEAAVRKYLSQTLGSRYKVTEGFIFDRRGQQSKQQDVIICDEHWSTKLTPDGSGEPALIPVESVYATIQVKKTLSSEELREALDNVRSFKTLEREALNQRWITPNRALGFVPVGDDPLAIVNPYVSAIFAYSAGRSIEAVFKQLVMETQSVPSAEWPDLIFVRNEGVILPFCVNCNGSGATINSVSLQGHSPTYYLDKLGHYSLVGFHLLLVQSLHNLILRVPDFHAMYRNLSYVSRKKAMGL